MKRRERVSSFLIVEAGLILLKMCIRDRYTLSRKRKVWYKAAFCVVAIIEIATTACMGFNEMCIRDRI